MLYGQSQVTACTQPVPPCVGSRCADVKTPPVEPLCGGLHTLAEEGSEAPKARHQEQAGNSVDGKFSVRGF